MANRPFPCRHGRRPLRWSLALVLLLITSCADDPGPTRLVSKRIDRVRIASTDYVKNRFFRFTAPTPFVFTTAPILRDDSASWPADWSIDPNSLYVYVSGAGIEGVTMGRGKAFVDRDGFGWFAPGAVPENSTVPDLTGVPFEEFSHWRELSQGLDWDFFVRDGRVAGLVLKQALTDDGTKALAVSYDVVDGQDDVVRRVGRFWGADDATIPDPADPAQEIYFFKLLKPSLPQSPFVNKSEGPYDITWEYMFRNFYDLGERDIDPKRFDLWIEHVASWEPHPDLDFSTPLHLPWLQVFGLDQLNALGGTKPGGVPDPDGRVDLQDTRRFDFLAGYLQFPDATPFDPPQESLDRYTAIANYPFDSSLRVPDLYRKTYAIPHGHRFDIVVSFER
jgi:hypothetical protein